MSDPTSAPANRQAKPLPNNLSGDTTRRRWACDRCHAQKLRCLRTINAEGGDCDRCIRVSATCGYSPPGRMGRPARSDSATSNSGKRARDASTTGNEPSKRHSPTPPTPPRSIAREPSADSSIDVPLDDLLLDHHSYPTSAPADTTFFPHFHDPNAFMSMAPDMTGMPFTPDSPNSGMFTTGFNPGPETFMGMHDTDKYVRELITLSLSQYEQFRLVERSRELTGLDKEALFTRLQGYPIGEMLENAQKLTGLIESFLQASRPRENSTGAYWNEFLGPLDLGKELVMDPEPMSSNASTDGSVMDFSDAWNMMPELPAIPTPNTASSISSGGMPGNGLGGKKADTSTTLLVLSCYIRLARLYILFFADLHCFLLPTHQPDPASSCDRRLFPGLKLGSFQPFAGTGLEISMVVQVSEHMLSRLHKALGLSSGDDSDNGSHGPNGRAWNWTSMEMITPVLMRAVQAQEGLDAQDDKGDTASQLGLAIDGVKRLLQARAFL